MVALHARPASVLYATSASFLAVSATPSAKCVLPMTCPGPGGVENVNPVTELALFGLRPKSPKMTLGPVFVTAAPAITPKPAAEPRGTVCAQTPNDAHANRSDVPPKFTNRRARAAVVVVVVISVFLQSFVCSRNVHYGIQTKRNAYSPHHTPLAVAERYNSQKRRYRMSYTARADHRSDA